MLSPQTFGGVGTDPRSELLPGSGGYVFVDSGPGEPRACAVCQGLSSSLSSERERVTSAARLLLIQLK